MAKIISHLFCVSIFLSLIVVSLCEQSTLAKEKDDVVSLAISLFTFNSILYNKKNCKSYKRSDNLICCLIS